MCWIHDVEDRLRRMRNDDYMDAPTLHDQRLAGLTIAAIYPLYAAKVEKKGRTVSELNRVILWLTGFDTVALGQQIKRNATFETFFQDASVNPNAHLITGLICGYRVE